MKKTKYISLLLAVVMLASVLLLAACNKEKPDDTTGDTTPAAPDTTAEPVSDELRYLPTAKANSAWCTPPARQRLRSMPSR